MSDDDFASGRFGNLLTFIFGFLGIASNYFPGVSRVVVGVTCLAGLVFCLLWWFFKIPKGMMTLTVQDWWRSHHHFSTLWLASPLNRVGNMGNVPRKDDYMVLYLPRYWDNKSLNETENPLVDLPGLTGEIKQRWSRTKYQALKVRKLNGVSVIGDFPGGLPSRLIQASYSGHYRPILMRWRIKGKRLALARKTLYFDGQKFEEHPGLRFIRKLRWVWFFRQNKSQRINDWYEEMRTRNPPPVYVGSYPREDKKL